MDTADEVGVLVLQVALAGLVQDDGLVQTALQLNVVLLEGVDRLGQLAAAVVRLLQIDDEHLHLAGQACLHLLQIVDLDDEGFDVLLQLGDADLVLATDLLDLLGAGSHLGVPLVLPGGGIGIGLDQLTFQVDAGLGLLLELITNRVQFDLNLMQRGFEQRATTVLVLQATAGVLQLGNDLALGERDRVQLDLQILDVLGQLNVLLREAGSVGANVDNGAVKLLDLHVQLGDRDLQLGDVLLRHDLLLVVGLDLGEQLVDFGLEFGLVLLGSASIRLKIGRRGFSTLVLGVYDHNPDT